MHLPSVHLRNVDEGLGVRSMTSTMFIANSIQSAGVSPYQRETSSPSMTRSIIVSRPSVINADRQIVVLKKAPQPLEEERESLEQVLAALMGADS